MKKKTKKKKGYLGDNEIAEDVCDETAAFFLYIHETALKERFSPEISMHLAISARDEYNAEMAFIRHQIGMEDFEKKMKKEYKKDMEKTRPEYSGA